MSFASFHLDHAAAKRLSNKIITLKGLGGDFDAMQQLSPLFGASMQTYVHIGLHSFTVIGEYVFLYESGALQHSFHMTEDSDELFKAFRLMCDHSSVEMEECIDLYEGYFTTRCVPAHRTVPGAWLDMAAEQRL